MLRRLSVRSFQRHGQRQIEYDPHITTFVGESDKGKSALAIRALFWLVFNRPSGDAFIKHGEDYVLVKLYLENHKITRKKSKSTNTYYLDGKKYKSFGQGVPDEIASILNLGEVNFQRQHDPPFWFNLSPGEVSKEINKIVNLDLIDKVLGNISKELWGSRTVEKVNLERLHLAREKEKELAWVEEANKEISKIEELEDKLKLREANILGLQNLLEDIQKLQKTSEVSQEFLDLGGRILDSWGLLEDIKLEIKILTNLLGEIQETCQKKENLDTQLTLAEEEMKKLTRGRCPVCQKPM